MCTCNRSPIACIIPPHMADRLIAEKKPNSAIFKNAVQTLSNDALFRSRRKLFRRLPEAGRALLMNAAFKAKPAAATMFREVYSAQNGKVQPGVLVRSEGQPAVADADVNNVYDAAGHTWDFYHSLFGRNSLDNKGLKLIQTVHYDAKYNNAFWDGQQMVYGDGDGKTFGSFTGDIDIIAHELTHGIVQYECNLMYENQSGALNESLADVFGVMIKQKFNNQDVHQANWLLGENVIIGNGYALRSLKAPGKAYQNHPDLGSDEQVASMADYLTGNYDNGYVHYNSGIPNHAFYLAAMKIGGYAWDKAGRVWYAAMCDRARVKEDAVFTDFRDATIYHAGKLFAGNPSVEKNIADAWKAVGL